MLMLGRKLSWEKYIANTLVTMIGQQVEFCLPRLSYDMVILQFDQFMHVMYEAKAKAKLGKYSNPETNFEVK